MSIAKHLIATTLAMAGGTGMSLPNLFGKDRSVHCREAACRTLDKCICSCGGCKREKREEHR